MISKKFIKNLKTQIDAKEDTREEIIKQASSITRKSKYAIFMIHRGDIENAKKELESLEKKLKDLLRLAQKSGLRGEAFVSASVEEFLEGFYFLEIILVGKIPDKNSFYVSPCEILGALSDLTGELVRVATLDVSCGNFSSVKKYKKITEDLFGALLQMNLRGILRQKRDDARRNLKRMEEILYDVSLIGK